MCSGNQRPRYRAGLREHKRSKGDLCGDATLPPAANRPAHGVSSNYHCQDKNDENNEGEPGGLGQRPTAAKPPPQ